MLKKPLVRVNFNYRVSKEQISSEILFAKLLKNVASKKLNLDHSEELRG